jgi:hypothetical protein
MKSLLKALLLQDLCQIACSQRYTDRLLGRSSWIKIRDAEKA